MSFTQVLEELPGFTFEQRQILIGKALELDNPPLSESDATIVASRLKAHRTDPAGSLSLE